MRLFCEVSPRRFPKELQWSGFSGLLGRTRSLVLLYCRPTEGIARIRYAWDILEYISDWKCVPRNI
jgi:hypothetical protein